MRTNDIADGLAQLFSELVTGADGSGGAFVLNTGDIGLLRSLDKLTAAEASRSARKRCPHRVSPRRHSTVAKGSRGPTEGTF